MPVDRTRSGEPIGDGQRDAGAVAPAQARRRHRTVDCGRVPRPAGDIDRHGSDLELKFGAAEHRRAAGRGKPAAGSPGKKRVRAGGGRALDEAAAGKRRAAQEREAAWRHLPAPPGVIAWISYMPPGCCWIVKFTRAPGLIGLRTTGGATGKAMVIPGQPISGMGPWLRFSFCCAGSTELTVPVPWASL